MADKVSKDTGAKAKIIMADVPKWIDQWIKFTATTAGRDKIYRFFQYFSRFLAYNLASDSNNLAERLAKLSLAISQSRKCKFNMVAILSKFYSIPH